MAEYPRLSLTRLKELAVGCTGESRYVLLELIERREHEAKAQANQTPSPQENVIVAKSPELEKALRDAELLHGEVMFNEDGTHYIELGRPWGNFSRE